MTEISKRNGGDLWTEIKQLYESKNGMPYEKIQSILTAEFDLKKFPSKRTIERRAKSENWKKKSIANNAKYDEKFWLVVRAVYEAHPRITYERIKETVMQKLQITEFPTQKTLSLRKKQEGWKPLELKNIKDDAGLRKLKGQVKRATKNIDDLTEQYKNNLLERRETYVDNDYDTKDIDDQLLAMDNFELVENMLVSKKRVHENLLMDANSKRLEMYEFMELSRKRLANISRMGDELSDAWVGIYALVSDPKITSYIGYQLAQKINKAKSDLAVVTSNFATLAYARQAIIKMEYQVRGLTMEDMRDEAQAELYVPSDEDMAKFEASKERLRLEAEENAKFMEKVLSGELQDEINAELERRIAEADRLAGDPIDDAVYEEIESE